MLNDTTVLNALQVKALLMDTITHLKFKQHLAPNFHVAKKIYCTAKGIKHTVTSWTLLTHIGQTYKDNGKLDEFLGVCSRMKYDVVLG